MACSYDDNNIRASDDEIFKQQFLDAHNFYRRKHDVPELILNDELNEQAKKWAEKLAKRQYMAYSELAGIGENITFFPVNMTPQQIVDYWYHENKKYEYETPGWQIGTNYFTQVIWRSTKEIGVGRKIVTCNECKNGALKIAISNQNGTINEQEKQIIVAFYRPAGNNNRAGQFASNVQKPVS